jgi:hypothetical protein
MHFLLRTVSDISGIVPAFQGARFKTLIDLEPHFLSTMQDLATVWLSRFASFASFAVIGVAGVKLSLYGDVIAEKSGMSRGWVGLIPLLVIYFLNPWFLHLHG